MATTFFSLDEINEIVTKGRNAISILGLRIANEKQYSIDSSFYNDFVRYNNMLDAITYRKDYDWEDTRFQKLVLKFYGALRLNQFSAVINAKYGQINDGFIIFSNIGSNTFLELLDVFVRTYLGKEGEVITIQGNGLVSKKITDLIPYRQPIAFNPNLTGVFPTPTNPSDLFYVSVEGTANGLLLRPTDVIIPRHATPDPTNIADWIIIQGWNADSGFYTNHNLIQSDLGGIKKGDTFNEVPYKELWDKLLYPYVQPTVFLNTGNNLTDIFEKGTVPVVNLTWSVTKKSLPVIGIKLYKLPDTVTNIPGFVPPALPFDPLPTASQVTGATIPSVGYSTAVDSHTWVLKAIDNTNNYTVSYGISFVYPILYGMSNLVLDNTNLYGALTKSIAQQVYNTDILFTITGASKYIYFAFPDAVNTFRIYDWQGLEITDAFDVSTVNAQSIGLTNNWTHSYKVLKLKHLTSVIRSSTFKLIIT